MCLISAQHIWTPLPVKVRTHFLSHLIQEGEEKEVVSTSLPTCVFDEQANVLRTVAAMQHLVRLLVTKLVWEYLAICSYICV